MSTFEDKSLALLPQGFVDLLPPDAGREADAISKLISCFQGYGYQRVKPPLLEFEDGLFAPGPGAPLKDESFRVMDPQSHRMMGVRSDITPQIARIAMTRLAEEPKPLRLCYANDVLRTKASQQRIERQFAQVGFELIGADTVEADLEVCVIALQALQRLDISELVLNITDVSILQNILHNSSVEGRGQSEDSRDGPTGNVPTENAPSGKALSENVPTENSASDMSYPKSSHYVKLLQALERRERDGLKDLPERVRDVLMLLMDVGQEPAQLLKALETYASEFGFSGALNRLKTLHVKLSEVLKQLNLNVRVVFDLLEQKGFEYKTGLAFTLYAKGVHGELGRGGRYDVSFGNTEQKDTAAGCTLYMDTLRRAMPTAQKARSVFVPEDIAWDVLQDLRHQGWIVVRGTGIKKDGLGTTHVYKNGIITEAK